MAGENDWAELLSELTTQSGENLLALSADQAVMVVFLRHFGCTFCREAMADIAKRKQEIEAIGAKIVLVHMSDNKTAEKYFKKFNLSGCDHISDPECRFYAAFGLVKGTINQLFGLQTWMRTIQTGVIKGYGWSGQIGDGFQMPGVFVLQNGEIKESFVHKMVSDRPDYEQLARCCTLV